MADNEIYMEDNSEVYTEDNSEVENRMYDFSTLSVGYTFQNWDDVDSFFEAYGQQFGFAIIKKRVERDNNIIRYRSLGCEFGGKYSPKKNIDINTHCNQKSKRQGSLLIDFFGLGNMYDQFVGEFFHCRNTLNDTLFETRWQRLLQKFLSSAREIDQLDVIFANINAAQVQQNQITQIVSKPLIIPHSVSTTTQLVVETDDDEMKQWLRAFIDRKKCSATNNNNEMSIDKENDLEIANPPVTKHKSRSETKQYKSAVEKAHRQPYACRACGQ
ncbi:16197_t:CDS:2, partial [Racocetra persica]